MTSCIIINIFLRYTNYREEKRPIIPIICRLEDLIQMAEEGKFVNSQAGLQPGTVNVEPLNPGYIQTTLSG
jgi:hypothetical protein